MRNDNKLVYRGVVYFYSEDEDGRRTLLQRHNAGTTALARLFACALVGENTELLKPDYIDVYDSYGASVLVVPCQIQDRHVEDGYQTTYPDELPLYNHRAYFETHITKKQIRANAAISAKKVSLIDGRNVELANIELDKNDFAEVFQSNDNLVIIWQMELLYDDIFEEVPDEYK